MKRLAMGLCVALLASAEMVQGSAVYLCTINGAKVYMDRPCPEGKEEKLNLPPLPLPSTKKMTADLGGFEWNILSVHRFYEGGKKDKGIKKPERNHFLVVEMTIKNKKDIPIDYNLNRINLVCDGEQYNSISAYPFNEQMGYERSYVNLIQPGATIKTYFAYDVNSSNKCKIVIYNIGTKDQVTLDIVP